MQGRAASPVMYGMDVLVQQPAVQPAMRPVKPGIMQVIQRAIIVARMYATCATGQSQRPRHALDNPVTFCLAVGLRACEGLR